MTLAVVLLLAGLGFVLAEVFFPSLGMLGFLALLCILGADVIAFEEDEGLGWGFVVAEILLVPGVVWLGFRLLPHVPGARRMLLEGPATPRRPGTPDLGALAGRRGTALTTLRPSGTARFGEERVSVVALGGLVPRGATVQVIDVEGSEVRVRAVEADPPPSPDPGGSVP